MLYTIIQQGPDSVMPVESYLTMASSFSIDDLFVGESKNIRSLNPPVELFPNGSSVLLKTSALPNSLPGLNLEESSISAGSLGQVLFSLKTLPLSLFKYNITASKLKRRN